MSGGSWAQEAYFSQRLGELFRETAADPEKADVSATSLIVVLTQLTPTPIHHTHRWSTNALRCHLDNLVTDQAPTSLPAAWFSFSHFFARSTSLPHDAGRASSNATGTAIKMAGCRHGAAGRYPSPTFHPFNAGINGQFHGQCWQPQRRQQQMDSNDVWAPDKKKTPRAKDSQQQRPAFLICPSSASPTIIVIIIPLLW